MYHKNHFVKQNFSIIPSHQTRLIIFSEAISRFSLQSFCKKFFLKVFAGTCVGRSTNATKNSFFTKKDFRFNRGYGIANVNTYIVSIILSFKTAAKEIQKSKHCLKSQALIHYLKHFLRQPAARKANLSGICVKTNPY